MSESTDLVSAYVLRDLARKSGEDVRPGKRVTMRVHARCGIAELGRYIPEGIHELVFHIDDVPHVQSLVEDWRTADTLYTRIPSAPPVGGPAVDGKLTTQPLVSRVLSQADVENHRQTMVVERLRAPGGPSPEVSFAEAFFAIAHRGMKPFISAEILDATPAPAKAKA